jgi:hypothetical protein
MSTRPASAWRPWGFVNISPEVKTAAADVEFLRVGRRSFYHNVAIHEAGHCLGLLLGLPVAGSTIEYCDGHFGATWSDDSGRRPDGGTVADLCAALTPLMARRSATAARTSRSS